MIGETLNNCTKITMVISFSGVALIACSPYILKTDDEDIKEHTLPYGMTSTGIANLIGCILILLNALC